MFVSLFQGAALLALCLALSGCLPTSGGIAEDQNNPFFRTGKDRVTARDYKGAIEAFEKVLEDNPRSPLTHYELGVLYDQHEHDYAAAIYHYSRVLKYRPEGYPADNARVRLAACRQELVKAEALAPVAQNVIRELDQLKEENIQLRQKLEAWQTYFQSNGRPGRQQVRHDSSSSSFTGPGRERLAAEPSPSPLPGAPSGARTHRVKAGETPYSIARQHGIKLGSLMAANPGLNPRRLAVGQTLNIPSQ